MRNLFGLLDNLTHKHYSASDLQSVPLARFIFSFAISIQSSEKYFTNA